MTTLPVTRHLMVSRLWEHFQPWVWGTRMPLLLWLGWCGVAVDEFAQQVQKMIPGLADESAVFLFTALRRLLGRVGDRALDVVYDLRTKLVRIYISYWNTPFLGDMLVFRGRIWTCFFPWKVAHRIEIYKWRRTHQREMRQLISTLKVSKPEVPTKWRNSQLFWAVWIRLM